MPRRPVFLALTGVCLLATVVSAAEGLSRPGTERSRGHARRLVRQMIAAAGGMERWNSVRQASCVLRTVHFGDDRGESVTVEKIYLATGPRPMVRSDIPRGRSIHTAVFDGQESWVAVDGILLQRDPSAHEAIRERAKQVYSWFSFPFHLVTPGVEVDYLGTTRLKGGEREVLQVTFQDSRVGLHADDVHRYYVDSATHLVVMEEYFPHGSIARRVDRIWGDYRLVDGLVKDHVREAIAGQDAHLSLRWEVLDLQTMAVASRDRFRKPRDPAVLEIPAE